MNLGAAIRVGDAATLLDKLRSGADVNRREPDGLTPLMVASGLGAFHLAELLLTAGADVHAIEPRMGASALHKAAQSGNPDVIGLLLAHGAFVDQQTPILGNTPLIDAVLHKHEGAVERLLRGGARTSIANHWGQTALDLARTDGLDGIARQIEAHDRTNNERINALSLMAAAKASDAETVARQIAAGAPVDEQAPMIGSTDDHYTALGIAAREGHVEVARRLLEAGADPTRLIGLMGGMPLHDAVYFGHSAIVALLIETANRAGTPVAGLNVQGAYNGLTALHDAVWRSHREVVRLLVEAGARVNLRSHTGKTPRELALLYGDAELAALLARAERERSDSEADHGEAS